ncbi:hypothetical protein ACFP3U_33325 [Kitasatospora misakiensis]|uniref:Uncharacterized protein n=1 Tax=Kitasatospora misakiensis TaxID=67330 RepID=A0ABW0XDE9_9ACTN
MWYLEYFISYTAPRIPVWALGEEPTVLWRDGVLVNLNATLEPRPIEPVPKERSS